jgi:hypothetical protein
MSSQLDTLYDDSECNPTETKVVLLHFLKFFVEFEFLKLFTFISFAFVLESLHFKKEDTWSPTAVMSSLCSTVRGVRKCVRSERIFAAEL